MTEAKPREDKIKLVNNYFEDISSEELTFENLEVIPSAVKPVIKNIETGISEKILIEEMVIIAFLVERGSTQNGRSSDEIYARLNSVLGKEFSVGSLKTAI